MSPMNTLSDELFLEILETIDCDEIVRVASLKTCCLVSKRWLRFSRPLLYEAISIRESDKLIKLHQALMGSSNLGGFVRHLDMTLEISPVHQPLEPDKLVAQCLAQTMDLEQLNVQVWGQDFITNSIAYRICCLPKLIGLGIMTDSEIGLREPKFKLDPVLFLGLPKTLQGLELYGTTNRLIELLPEICERLHRPPTISEPEPNSPGSSLDSVKPANHTPGLRSLVIDPEYCPGREPNKIFKALGHALAPTLESFTLEAPLEASILFDFLSAVPLLQSLQLNSILISPVSFDGLPVLTELRTLEMDVDQEYHRPDWDGFYRSLGNFLSHLPHLETFSFPQGDVEGLCTSKLIDVILESTTKNEEIRSPLHKDVPISSLLNVEISNSNVPSIEALERLCQLAPLLEYLEIAVPLDHLPRATTAIGNLKHLTGAELTNSTLSKTYSITRGIVGEPIDLSALVSEMT